MEDVAKAASNHHWGEGYLEINGGWANMRKHVRATQSLEIKHLWFECLNFSVISSCFHKNPHHGKGLINQSGRRDVSEFSPYLGMAWNWRWTRSSGQSDLSPATVVRTTWPRLMPCNPARRINRSTVRIPR